MIISTIDQKSMNIFTLQLISIFLYFNTLIY